MKTIDEIIKEAAKLDTISSTDGFTPREQMVIGMFMMQANDNYLGKTEESR